MRDRFHTKQAEAPASVRGFTLMELMVVTVVVGVLAAIAIPGYQSFMMKSRREDARTTLTMMVQAQERFRSNNATYSQNVQTLLGRTAEDSNTGSIKGYYTMSLSGDPNNSGSFASGYVVQAIAGQSSLQFNDTPCRTISVVVSGGNLRYRDLPTSTALSSPCWPQ